MAEQLSEKYHNACKEAGALGLVTLRRRETGEVASGMELPKMERAHRRDPRLKLRLTHEEIAQMIGTSRETVTRLFAEMRKRQIVRSSGSTLVIRNAAALREHREPQLMPRPPRQGLA